MKKFLCVLCTCSLVFATVSPSVAADVGAGPEMGIAVEYHDRGWTTEQWLNYEELLLDSKPNVTNNHIEVEYNDRNWSADQWLDFAESVVPDSIVDGNSMPISTYATSEPTEFFDSNKSSYTTSFEDIAYRGAFYSDHYFPSGAGNKMYLVGSATAVNDLSEENIWLDLYEYSPNYGVYGTRIDYKFETLTLGDSGEYVNFYTLDVVIKNLQPNNLYYFKFINGSGQTLQYGSFTVSGNPL